MIPHLTVPLKNAVGSYLKISTGRSSKVAIVFIHGWCGDARTTWLQFQNLVDLEQDRFSFYGHSDLYFYNYDSVRPAIPVNAQKCLDFIRDIYPHPDPTRLFFDDVLSPPDEFGKRRANYASSFLPSAYDGIVLVGHSLGGLLLRAAIWSVFRDMVADDSLAPKIAKEPLLSAELALFSPALLGSELPNLAARLITLFGGIPGNGQAILKALGIFAASVDGLASGGVVLSEIKRCIEKYSEKFSDVRALRARVMWGAREDVVEMWQYELDSPVKYSVGKHHLTVCKPLPEYLDPLEFVIYGREASPAAH